MKHLVMEHESLQPEIYKGSRVQFGNKSQQPFKKRTPNPNKVMFPEIHTSSTTSPGLCADFLAHNMEHIWPVGLGKYCW